MAIASRRRCCVCGGGGEALVEPRLEREVADLKDRYLRLAAEYDNFRKRALKERTEAWEKAQADLVLRLVDALDDLARFAHVDPSQTDAKTIHDGVDLVERKLWKERSEEHTSELQSQSNI